MPLTPRRIRDGFLACLLLGLACPAPAADEADLGPGVSLTIYNQDFAVVKERRLLDLTRDAGVVKFPDVAGTIVPESVQFTALRPTGAKVLEQNYEFDLLSADKLLHKYIDREISVVGRDGSLTEGKLLAAEGNHLVMASRGGIELIPRRNNIKDIRFSSLPEGLLLRPTLVWKVRAQQPGEHLVKIAYAATGIKWRVDYRAVASADETTLDVAGWVTIDNRTGTTFKDAGLKLLAGDVHLVPKKSEKRAASAPGSPASGLRRVPAFEEKAFGEYHLYTLGRRTTLANAQTKQIELLKVGKIPVAKVFLYRPDFRHRLLKILKFQNSKDTCPGLGIPLPKGPFRVYQRDTDGQAEFTGADAIGHTPKDETVQIRMGYASDLVADRVQTIIRRRAGQNWEEQDWKITIRNHKDQPVKVILEEPLQHPNRNGKIVRTSHEHEKKDFRTLKYQLDVPANDRAEVTYTVQYNW